MVSTEQGEVVRLTASFGVATVLAGHDVSVDFVLREADAVLYQAKASGRNQVLGQDYSQDVLPPNHAGLPRLSVEDFNSYK